MTLTMNETQQLNRIETKLDATVESLHMVKQDVAVLKAQFEPWNRLLWMLIGGGALAFLTSIASLIMVVKK